MIVIVMHADYHANQQMHGEFSMQLRIIPAICNYYATFSIPEAPFS